MFTVLREISAFLLFVGLVVALAQWARRLRPLPLGLAGAVGLALLVAVEIPLFHLLSALGAVRAGPVALTHAALLALTLRPGRLPRVPRRALWLLPPFALALLSSLRYAPNNLDAQAYHLARVAHWIQNGSVGFYPSPVFSQNAHAAAGEYLLLQLQLVAGTDRLAFLPQLLAWVLLAASAPAVARLAGAPARLARWAFLPVGTLPMAVLQAGSAQNDLLAAVMAVAAGAAALPFLHARTVRLADGVLLGASVAAAAALKAPGVLAAAPLLMVAALRLVGLAARQWRALLPGLLALAVAAALYAPEWGRLRLLNSRPEYVLEWSYPAIGEWGDRAQNLVRSVLRHLPGPANVVSWGRLGGCAPPGEPLCTWSFVPHEDVAGSPLAVAVALAALLVGLARWRRLGPRRRAALGCALAAWLISTLIFRDNPWVARIQLPLFALWPLLLAAFAGWRAPRPLLAALGALALGHALYVGAENIRRPPLVAHAPRWRDSYYEDQPAVRAVHDAVLAAARAQGCTRVGLFVKEPRYEYALVWRAMQQGLSVHHVQPEDPWPCLLYYERDAGARPAGWAPTPWTQQQQSPLAEVLLRG